MKYDWKIAIIISVIAGAIYLFLYRPLTASVPTLTSLGTVKSRVFVAAHTEATGTRQRSMQAQTRIKVDDQYLIQIQLDDGASVKTTWPASTIEQLPVGQRVHVTYERKGIPLLWRKNYFVDMKILSK